MKTPNPIHHSRRAGLTLIELIVIIAVIVMLALFSLPTHTHGGKKGRQTDSLNNAKQITLALRMYADDNGGKFPSIRTDGTSLVPSDPSNRAFEHLIPKNSFSKKIFANKVSAWCRNPVIDTAATDSSTLKQGQNDWNYVAGLSINSDPRWPLIATATASAANLTYSNVMTAKGGVWGGTASIIGFADGSARLLSDGDMNLTDKTKTFPKRPDNGASIFTATEDWLGIGRVILAPE